MSQALSIKLVERIIEIIRSENHEDVMDELIKDLVLRDKKLYEIIYLCTIHNTALEEPIRAELIDKIQSIDSSSCSYSTWLLCFSIAMHTGNFSLAYLFRENAKRNIYIKYRSGERNTELLCKLLSLAIEDGDDALYIEIRKVISKKEGIPSNKLADLDHLDMIFSFCNGTVSKIAEKYISNNQDYYNYISGKKIALVVPTLVETLDASEIDGSDVVVRLNYSYKGQGCDMIYKGVRTDISYYNKMTLNKLDEEFSGQAPDDLKFLVGKGKSIDRNNKYRRLYPFDNSLLNGTFNMLPNTLFDLLVFSPSEIKIFHSDMQLKPSLRVKNYYSENSILNEDELFKASVSKSFSIHDPFGQLNIIRRIVKNNSKVLADDILTLTLNMSNVEYASCLTENYRVNFNKKALEDQHIESTNIELISELRNKIKSLNEKAIHVENKLHLMESQKTSQERVIAEMKIKIKNQKIQFSKLKSSFSWKLTKPIRFVGRSLLFMRK
ncbi:hypothetical protein KP803_08165 [Vibrio sp. ZSDE26]|uniref:Uncharacterized protein n=1 Tax=Vibrio amylolyticus TaxID=2847292 RepID=A0A9X1XJH9_9VIBR|nr:hypothetical protein [Vibrio amylolyticus]MCK6263250.1 hypothetical protein [Vibrio amylolyticus]